MTDYTPEDTGTISNPEGSTTNSDIVGIAEFQADFQSRLTSLVKASLTKRPDSVALDYLTAFCLGPVANADTSLGAVSHVWKCRVDNSTRQVLIARENDTKDGWNDETELFSFDDDLAEINEVDIAFTQNGRPTVCASRSTGTGDTEEVWLYWFDSTDSTFGFDNFGAGRTPRVILDAPFNITDSDVLFFYLTDTKLVYRQQQDRYGTEIETPMTITANTYIEDVVKLRSGRIKVELIKRNESTGKYSVDGLTSTLYPISVGPDNATAEVEFTSADLVVVVIVITLQDIDELETGLAFISATNTEPVIVVTLSDTDDLETGLAFTSATLVSTVLVETLSDIDELETGLVFSSAELDQVVIVHTLVDISELETSLAFTSATLETV